MIPGSIACRTNEAFLLEFTIAVNSPASSAGTASMFWFTKGKPRDAHYVIYMRSYERTDGKRTKWEIVETEKDQTIGELAPGSKISAKTVTIMAKTEIKRPDPKKGIPEINVLGVVDGFYVKDEKIKTLHHSPNMLVKTQEDEEREHRKKLEARGRRSSNLPSQKKEKAAETRGDDDDPTSC